MLGAGRAPDPAVAAEFGIDAVVLAEGSILSADAAKAWPKRKAPSSPQKAFSAANFAHCDRTMPELRPEAPPPQISASTMATSRLDRAP